MWKFFPQSPAVPKGRRALQEAACRLCTRRARREPPTLRVRVAGTPSQNVLRAPLRVCKARGRAVTAGVGGKEQKFPSTLSRVERLQTLPVGSAGARLCCCCRTGCGTLQNPCLCRTTSRPGSAGNPGGHGRLVGEFKPPDSPWLAATVSQLGKRLAVPLCPQLEQGELMAPSCWRAALTARVLIP